MVTMPLKVYTEQAEHRQKRAVRQQQVFIVLTLNCDMM